MGSGPLAVSGTVSWPRRVRMPRCRAPRRVRPTRSRRNDRPEQAVQGPGLGAGQPRGRGPALRQGDLRPSRRGQPVTGLHRGRRVPPGRSRGPPAAPRPTGRRSADGSSSSGTASVAPSHPAWPRQAALAGLVILAGGTQPLHWSAVRQVRYLASLDPVTAAAAQPVIERCASRPRRSTAPELSPRHPASSCRSASRPRTGWTCAATSRPPLRRRWASRSSSSRVAATTRSPSTGIYNGGRPASPGVRVTIHVYPADNHMFFPGTGPSAPPNTRTAQHLDPAVVADIVEWIRTSAARASS